MNRLFQFIIGKLDARCRAWETGLVSGRRIPDHVQEDLDVPFQGAEGLPLAVDIFRAKTRDLRPLPVVVMIHGGGLMVGTRKMSRAFCENLAARGFLVFAPEYRRITETNAFQEIGDVTASLSFISGLLPEYGGDPDRVAVVSESAGAFLSVYTVAAAGSPALREVFGLPASPLQIRALACFCGMFYTTRRDLPGLFYPRYLYGKRRKDASFMRCMNPEYPDVTDSLPPVFLAGSDADFLKGYTKRYAAALRGAGHPCTLVYFENNKELTHSFPALKPDLPESREVMDQLVEWMAEISGQT
jgi:acetyl esterase/lipase